MAQKDYIRRQVIEGKLLAALDDEDKVAIVASKRDCELIMRCLELTEDQSPSREEQAELRQMRLDLRQLYDSAFVS